MNASLIHTSLASFPFWIDPVFSRVNGVLICIVGVMTKVCLDTEYFGLQETLDTNIFIRLKCPKIISSEYFVFSVWFFALFLTVITDLNSLYSTIYLQKSCLKFISASQV